MKSIVLSSGLIAVVDEADFERVSAFRWHSTKKGRRYYAFRNLKLTNGKWTTQFLHQFITGHCGVDHKDGDGLHNWRDNLRRASHLQNSRALQRKRVGTTSKYRGVSWHAGTRKFEARIFVEGRKLFLGRFEVEGEAATAYDDASRKYFGEFASPNFP